MSDTSASKPDSVRRAALFGGLLVGLAAPFKASATQQASPAADGVIAKLRAPANRATNAAELLRAALFRRNTEREGGFSVELEEGDYLLAGGGRSILTIQASTRLMGSALEGTQFRVAPASTAQALLSDDSDRGEGSAAKVEIYNLTLNGGGNTRLAALLDLGTDRSIPFGTYGRLDNLMARDAPAATAYRIGANIAVVGDLYSMNTRDGLVTSDGGSGCHVRGMYPYGFSRYGIYLGGIGDNVLNGEGEAPTSDDAVYVYGSRSFIVGLGSHLVAVAKGTTLKRPFVIDTTMVGDWALGPWMFVRADREQRFGDFGRPIYSGIAATVGENSLTDPEKKWELDELKGWAVRIESGPGRGNWAEVACNSVDTLWLRSRSWISTGPRPEAAPVAGSRYALAPALCTASGGGLASSKVLTLADAVIRALHARTLRAASFLVGSSNDAANVTGISRVRSEILVGPVRAGERVKHRLTLRGAEAGDFVMVTAPALRASGISIEAEAQQGEVVLYLENRTPRPVSAVKAMIGALVVKAE